jgi:hypothetical protein
VQWHPHLAGLAWIMHTRGSLLRETKKDGKGNF